MREQEMLVSEAGRVLGLSKDAVRRLVDRGVLRARRVSGIRLLLREDVFRLAEERRRAREEKAARLEALRRELAASPLDWVEPE